MLALAIPMYVFYEISVVIGWLVSRRRAKAGQPGRRHGLSRPDGSIAVRRRAVRPGTLVACAVTGPRCWPATSFPLDPFQLQAIDALDAGQSVLVAAPTGSGKTVVAEYAVAVALAEGQRAFYTAPIKALSNQKFHDLRAIHGADRVGLLTGDNAINGDAPVVVMTTEVLRNMIYGRSPALRRPGRRRARRGPLPAGHLPRAGVGGGDHPPAAGGAPGVPVGHGLQRRGAGGVDDDGPGPDRGGHRGAAAGHASRTST